jgi:hypothetical protein
MKPPFHRRATIGAQLAAFVHFLFWLFVALMAAAGCSLPARNVDAGVHRVRGASCPARSQFLYSEYDRAHSWCRDTTRAGR